MAPLLAWTLSDTLLLIIYLVHSLKKTPRISNNILTINRLFYILSNVDTITATWSDGLIVEQITGNISDEYMKKIIDSMEGYNLKRICASFLAIVMLFATYGYASAVNVTSSRASLTLSRYFAEALTGSGRGEIIISYDVKSSKIATSVGVESIVFYTEEAIM